MNHYLNAKVSSITDAVLGLTSALMQISPLAEGQRVQVIRHVHEGRSLVELRVVRDHDRTTSDYGVRQAWIYAYPDTAEFEMHYTHRDDIVRLVKAYPHLKSNASVVYVTQQKAGAKFSLQDIYQACDILHSFLADTTDMVPNTVGNIESNLPQQDA
jgi:hypothetical protein